MLCLGCRLPMPQFSRLLIFLGVREQSRQVSQGRPTRGSPGPVTSWVSDHTTDCTSRPGPAFPLLQPCCALVPRPLCYGLGRELVRGKEPRVPQQPPGCSHGSAATPPASVRCFMSAPPLIPIVHLLHLSLRPTSCPRCHDTTCPEAPPKRLAHLHILPGHRPLPDKGET